MSALTKTYPTEDLYLYEINALKNYRETNGIVTKLVNNLTIDFQSFNDNNLSYHAILYNDTDKELAVYIKTTYGERNTKKANQLLLNLYESIVVANQNKPSELIKWKSKYGSTQNENADGESFDTYWNNYKTKLRKERGLDLGSIQADLQNYTNGSS